MELKTKEDFVKAFIACGKKYGMAQYDEYPKDRIRGFYNGVPNDLGNEKLYLVTKTVYEKGETYVEHVTEKWNHSEEEYEPCDPYDITHSISYEVKEMPVFAFFVKPSFIGKDGVLYHIVTDITGTQYNRRNNKVCEPYGGTYHNVWTRNTTFHSDYVQIKYDRDSACGSGHFNKPVSVYTHVYYQNNKLFAKFADYDCGHEGEVELTDDWRAFTTYEEVLAFQKSEEQRLKSNVDDLNSMHEHLQNSVKELIEHAKDVLYEIKAFKIKTKNYKNFQNCRMERFIEEYSNFNFFDSKWINW